MILYNIFGSFTAISGFLQLSLDHEKLANEPTPWYFKKHVVLAHHTFSFQGGLSFKEWIVLGEGSHDNKPLKLEKNAEMKDNIVGGGCSTNDRINGTRQIYPIPTLILQIMYINYNQKHILSKIK